MKISVITIARNDRDGVQRTVESVRNQTHEDVEHIVVDAASSDGTVDYLRSLAPPVRWVSERDGGRYDGMNKGVRMATGRLVWFMHSRDVFGDPDVLAKVARSYESVGWRWAFGLARLMGEDGDSTGILGTIPFNFKRFALGGRPIPHQAAIFEKALFDELGGYSTTFGLAEDQHFMLRCAAKAAPHELAHFLCNFDTSGAGSTRPVMAHYRDMMRGRKLENIRVFGKGIDGAVSIGLAGIATVGVRVRRALANSGAA